FFFYAPSPTVIYPLSLHDALPICGPSFIEALTYRLGDHTTADDARRYRSVDELEGWVAKDPMVRTRKFLQSRGLWDQEKQVAKTDRKSTRLNSSHDQISYAVFCLK